MIFDSLSSRISSSSPTIPARKKTLVNPTRYSLWSNCNASTSFVEASFPSMKPDGMADAAKIWYLNKKSKHNQKQPTEVFCKQAVLKKFAIFKRKHLCWSLFLISKIHRSKVNCHILSSDCLITKKISVNNPYYMGQTSTFSYKKKNWLNYWTTNASVI